MTTHSHLHHSRFSEELAKTNSLPFPSQGENKEEFYGRGIKHLYRTRWKGTLSQFLSMILSLYGICYILTGIRFLSWMEQYGVTGSYCTLQSNKHKQMAKRNVSHAELTRLVNSTGLCFIVCNSASFAFLFSLCWALCSPFFFVLFPQFFARTVTLSLSPWLCYSACLISRSLIGWLPAPREIPFSLPPTHPPTHPPVVRKCERGWWKLIGRAGVLAPVLDVTAGRRALSSLFSVRFGFRQGSKHGMLPSGNSWHTAPLSGFPAPGKCLFLSICCYCHLVWVLLGWCVCVFIFKQQVN